MSLAFQSLTNELKKDARSIELACNAVSFFEKFFWSTFGFVGIIWACYFIPSQIRLWGNNPTMITWKPSPLSLMNYPAVTIAPKQIIKYGIAEQIGNYINPDNIPENFLELKKMLLESALLAFPTDDIYDTKSFDRICKYETYQCLVSIYLNHTYRVSDLLSTFFKSLFLKDQGR